MPSCEPEKSPCGTRGLSWFDWAHSIHSRLCDVISWLSGIYGHLKIAPYGKVALATTHFGFNAGGPARVITIPAGAISINAIVDNEHGASKSMTVQVNGGTGYPLPLGVDLYLPPITPVYSADVDGLNSVVGYGHYPEYTISFPADTRGYVTATYRGLAQPFTIV